MGYTSFTLTLVTELLAKFNPKSVIDLGAQNNYAQPKLPAPYMKEWYEEQKIDYLAIDINNENGAAPLDLSKPLPVDFIERCDMLVDAGTSEHVSDGKGGHDIKAIYNCWKTKNDLLNIGGIMLNENPKTGNWPGHGCNYYTQDFYIKLAELQGYELLSLQENAAMGNVTDGWNVTCVLRKVNDHKFISLETFKLCGIKTS
ncbi:MAG: hypothetical protein K0S44_201 [Bacteroidetes bacterium]|jgi:hypothetical protein|nr:hypothetical protein [Bacteroidota bacterium]